MGPSARFNGPKGIAVDPNNQDVVYVTDTTNKKIKMLEFDGIGGWTVTTIAGSSAGCCADGAPRSHSALVSQT